ncbi:Mannitol 2-dehydrogenase [Frankliniella fusca]|uniref:Mannitol 2-dehydrogenase n=1 Tax=Frankliniella fusca TaxID=407009 RepID=A0AAE1HQQ7_9NEOP|nr:Mannitol 2-dehydrogenase [Frankliniella fusca]
MSHKTNETSTDHSFVDVGRDRRKRIGVDPDTKHSETDDAGNTKLRRHSHPSFKSKQGPNRTQNEFCDKYGTRSLHNYVLQR